MIQFPSLCPSNTPSPSSRLLSWVCQTVTSACPLWISTVATWVPGRRYPSVIQGLCPASDFLSLQTKEALLKILADVKPGDNFDLVLFGSQVQSWKGSLVPASEANLRAAQDFVRRFSLAGGKGRVLRIPWYHFHFLGIWVYTGPILLYSHKPEWRLAPRN